MGAAAVRLLQVRHMNRASSKPNGVLRMFRVNTARMSAKLPYTRRLLLGHGFSALALGPGAFAAEPRPAAHAPRRAAAAPVIILDPGHGGKDPGAIGTQGTQEKRITLAAALELQRQLLAGGHCRVALTRRSDVFVALGDRVEFARRREASPPLTCREGSHS